MSDEPIDVPSRVANANCQRGLAEGAAAERARIVAWLRSDDSAKIGKLPGNPTTLLIGKFERDVLARDIERGEHAK